MGTSSTKARLVWGLTLCAAFVGAQDLTDGQIGVVSARLAEAALMSWELGTRAQTILELNASQYSVFSRSSLPPPKSIPSSLTSSHALDPFFAIAHDVVANRSTANNHTSGPQPLLPDGSAGDPASIGVAVLLADWTGQDAGQLDYMGAAQDQLEFLMNEVPRTSDGAISHRVAEVQLWSDFVYMVPPFLAYYGVLTRNRTLLVEAYDQIRLYRGHLRDNSTGLWMHVLLGADWNDPGFWCTGNGWAAAGMLRVYATMHRSEYANTFKNEQQDLASWVKEIHDAVYPHADDTRIFTNYPTQPASAPGNFYDAACTALLASTVYRAALLTRDGSHVADADRAREALFAKGGSSASLFSSSSSASGSASSGSSSALSSSSSASRPSSSSNSSAPAPTPTTPSPSSSSPSSTHAPPTRRDTSSSSTDLSNYTHLTPQGWLTPVVNPHSFGVEGAESAEAQAFVVQLHAAWGEWVGAGEKVSAARGRWGASGSGSGGWMGVLVGVALGGLGWIGV